MCACMHVSMCERVCACVRASRGGDSRQMAFVGYKLVEQAVAAVKYFNRSYMDTSRLDVQVRQGGAGGGD